MSFDNFSTINNFMDSNESSGLRRSKRRNKFHLDVAAMLTGNNPDRRLSPQPHHQTNFDNKTFIVTSKQSKRSIQKLLKPKLNILQSVKSASINKPILNGLTIIKNDNANFSSTKKVVTNLQNLNKPKSIDVPTPETTSKSQNLQASSLVENSAFINKASDNSITKFSTVPSFSSNLIVSSTQNFSYLTNTSEKMFVNKFDQQSSSKSIAKNTLGTLTILNPNCSSTSTVQKVPITTNSQSVSMNLNSQVIYYVL